MIKRQLKKVIKLYNHTITNCDSVVFIGGEYPISIQSMTNTKTSDIESTVKQIKELEENGCDIVRLAVLNMEDALSLKQIIPLVSIPVVADIHFDYKLALASIDAGVAKLRINPGNIDNIEEIKQIVQKCKETNTPIRIGVNSGSINKDIYAQYGNTPEALVQSAIENIKILESLDFYDIAVSIKASSVLKTIAAYEMFSSKYDYPIHLGLTEAGTSYSGSIKSSVALGSLLLKGIGDTIRVSLTTNPVNEVKCAKEILSSLGLYKKPELVSCPTCGRCQYDMLPIAEEIENFLNKQKGEIKVAVMGCIVNGPGEAKDSDIGIAGGKNSAILFKHGKVVCKVHQNEIISVLKNEILLHLNKFTYEITNVLNDDIRKIREEVFMNEQGFVNEFDEIDNHAVFVSIYDKEKIIGCGRMYKDKEYYCLGRICVSKNYRNKRIGSSIIMLLEREVKNDGSSFKINSQATKKEFYEENGYKETGKKSYDENCLHVEMIKIK